MHAPKRDFTWDQSGIRDGKELLAISSCREPPSQCLVDQRSNESKRRVAAELAGEVPSDQENDEGDDLKRPPYLPLAVYRPRVI